MMYSFLIYSCLMYSFHVNFSLCCLRCLLKIFWSVFWSGSLVLIYLLSCCFSLNVFISPYILKESFVEYVNLGWKLFDLKVCNISLQDLLSFKICVKKSIVILISLPLYMTLFFLWQLSRFCLFLWAPVILLRCISGSFFFHCSWCSASLVYLHCEIFPHNWKALYYDFRKQNFYFMCALF